MFTGIIEAIGIVKSINKRDQSAQIELMAETRLDDIKIGESIAVNGVCLTVTSILGNTISADVSFETLRVTTLGKFSKGDRVNIERPLAMGARLGGHLVQGHVDGIGKIVKIQDVAEGKEFKIKIPGSLSRYIVDKGSVAVNGVSLTVVRCIGNEFTIAIIPHTLASTTFGAAKEGMEVNLEVDIVGKYVEKLKQPGSGDDQGPSKITEEFLKRHGF